MQGEGGAPMSRHHNAQIQQMGIVVFVVLVVAYIGVLILSTLGLIARK